MFIRIVYISTYIYIEREVQNPQKNQSTAAKSTDTPPNAKNVKNV